MKNNFKKTVSLMLALALVLCIASCGGDKKTSKKDENPASKSTGVEKFVNEYGNDLEKSFEEGFKNGAPAESASVQSADCTVTVDEKDDTILEINCTLDGEISEDAQTKLKAFVETDNFKSLASLKDVDDLTAIKITVKNMLGQNIVKRTIEIENSTTEQ